MMSDEGENPLVSSRKISAKKIKSEKLASSNGRDEKAFAEVNAINNDDYEQRAYKNYLKRKDAVQRIIAQILIAYLKFGRCLGYVVLTVLIHFILPSKFRWLDDGQVDKLVHIIQIAFAAVGGYLVPYARQIIKSDTKSHAPQ